MADHDKDPKTSKASTLKPKAKKHHLFLPVLVGIVTFLAGIVLTVVVGAIFLNRTLATPAAGANFAKISSVYQTIQGNYYKPVSSTKLINGAINGMVASLDDPFSEYLPKEDATDLNSTIAGSFGGIGASVKQDGDYVTVDAPVKNTPASKAGLKTNDVILKIDHKSAKGLTTTQVVNKIRGKVGSKVTLTLKRGEKTFTTTLTRAKIPVTTVSGSIDKQAKNVGYIQISTFSEPTADELKQKVKALRKKGATRFIIDVRGNPGGALPTALATSSMFLKNGAPIMKVQDRAKETQTYRASKDYDGGFKVKEPTVVLIDGDAASASEIFASALKESAHDPIIGTQSYGKGTVQTVSDLGNDSEMKITTAKWLTPKGHWINKKGVTPTIKADYPSYAYLTTFDTSKTYRLNDSSRTIISIQKILNALGYTVDQENGVYDTSMQMAVQRFQNDQNSQNQLDLPTDGTVDQATGDALITALGTLVGDHDQAYQKAIETLND